MKGHPETEFDGSKEIRFEPTINDIVIFYGRRRLPLLIKLNVEHAIAVSESGLFGLL